MKLASERAHFFITKRGAEQKIFKLFQRRSWASASPRPRLVASAFRPTLSMQAHARLKAGATKSNFHVALSPPADLQNGSSRIRSCCRKQPDNTFGNLARRSEHLNR